MCGHVKTAYYNVYDVCVLLLLWKSQRSCLNNMRLNFFDNMGVMGPDQIKHFVKEMDFPEFTGHLVRNAPVVITNQQ